MDDLGGDLTGGEIYHMVGSIMLRVLLFVVPDMCWVRSRYGSFHAMALSYAGFSVHWALA